MKKEKIKVYTYTRVSNAMQVDGYSLDAQKAKMKAYAFALRYCKVSYLWSWDVWEQKHQA